LTANFQTQYLLTTGVSPGGSGSITASPSSGDGFYNSDASVQLTATPIAGSMFAGFSGALTGVTNPQSLVMNAPKTVIANFTANAPPIASFTSSCTALTCTFNGAASSDSDGTITSYAWSFGDATTGAGVTTSHTYAAAGTYAVSLTVRDNVGATGVRNGSVTVSPPTIHIGDLDGTATNQQNTWTAVVTTTLHDSSHGPVSGATVSGSWSTGGTASCTTDGGGQCLVSKSAIPKSTKSLMFSIVNATNSTLLYRSVDNHDPDGDSNGTSIAVSRP
jgi:PKD repeat protein